MTVIPATYTGRGKHEAATVYTFLGENDAALYIGCTINPASRIGTHQAKDWWTDVECIVVEHFEARPDALRRERELIERLRPQHNVTGVPGRDPRLRATRNA